MEKGRTNDDRQEEEKVDRSDNLYTVTAADVL